MRARAVPDRLMAPLTPERIAYLRRVVDGETPGPPHTELIYDTLAGLLATIDAHAAVIRRLLDGWRPGKSCRVVEAGSPRPDSVRVWMHREMWSAGAEPLTDAEAAVIDAVRDAGSVAGEDAT